MSVPTPQLSETLDLLERFETLCTDNTNAWYAREPLAKGFSGADAGLLPPPPVPAPLALPYGSLPSNRRAPLLEPVTFFQSSVLPAGLRLTTLAKSLLRASRHDVALLRVALVLMLRYAEMTTVAPTLHTMHRQLVAGLHLASKAHSDAFLSTADAALVSGVSPLEMARLERELTRGCDWRLWVERAEVEDVVKLRHRIQRAHISPPAPQLPPRTAINTNLRSLLDLDEAATTISPMHRPTPAAASTTEPPTAAAAAAAAAGTPFPAGVTTGSEASSCIWDMLTSGVVTSSDHF